MANDRRQDDHVSDTTCGDDHKPDDAAVYFMDAKSSFNKLGSNFWRVFCAIFCVVLLAVLAYGLFTKPDDTLNDKSVRFIYIFYTLTMPGFLPPFIYFILTGAWTASPFVYDPRKNRPLMWHIITGFMWLILILIQIYYIEQGGEKGDHKVHKAIGSVLAGVFVGCFVTSAMFSAFWVRLSPLGGFVRYMETGLSIGIITYLGIALAFVFNGYKDEHRVCIVAMSSAAGGPGIFRSLRSLREAIRMRLFNPGQYGHYWDQSHPDNSKANKQNFIDVEATYFCSAFLLTSAILYGYFYAIGWDKTYLCYFFCFFPACWIIMGVLLSFKFESLKWFPALDYNYDIPRTSRSSRCGCCCDFCNSHRPKGVKNN